MSAVYMWFMKKAIARMAEQGSRQLLYAALAGAGSEDDKFRGAYISATQISEVSDFVLESHELQDKLWVRWESVRLRREVDWNAVGRGRGHSW
ncbi:hypothetical protein J132_08330 [Termitomyces sp. J132]|nr:hypothetical protein J132_08330 [Termitomyces sp. J132]